MVDLSCEDDDDVVDVVAVARTWVWAFLCAQF